MAEHRADGASEAASMGSRRAWLRARGSEIDEVLDYYCSRLHTLIPSDLGDRRLVGALAAARIAADEARVQPVGDTVAWLELLIPHGYRHDLGAMVQEFRSALPLAEEPSLRSWNVEAWERLLVDVWWRERCAMVDPRQAEDELVSRWGLSWSVATDMHHRGQNSEPYDGAVGSLTEHLAKEGEVLGLLAQAVLTQPYISESIEASLAVADEALQGAGHLTTLMEEEARVQELTEWAEGRAMGAGSEAMEAFLRELVDECETYRNETLTPARTALSEYERKLLRTADSPDTRDGDAYLEEFLGCLDSPPQNPDGTLDSRTAEEAVARGERGETTWHTMRGSVPVWYHIVGSPQERAAALAFSGAASSRVVRMHAEVDDPPYLNLTFDDLLDGMPGQPQDWYPDPGIELRYSRESVTDLCELLALTRLRHARLEFLVPDTHGGFALLRSLRAEIPPGNIDRWAYGALKGLRTLVPDVDDLADLIADEPEDEGQEGDETLPQGGPEPTEASPADDEQSKPGSPPPSTATRLPEHLLAKVKALLRKAEDPAASSPEAEAYLRKATELMAKYGIEQAMLRSDEPTSEQPVDQVVEVTAPWMRECKRLLGLIALEMRCQAVYPGGKSNRHRVHLFGFAADLQAVSVLYASLRLQMLQGADRAGEVYRPEGEESRAYKRSWILGFIRAVTQRIGEAQRQAREETEQERQDGDAGTTQGRSVALVLADRSAAVTATVSSRYPKLGKTRRTTFKGSGYWQGTPRASRRTSVGLPWRARACRRSPAPGGAMTCERPRRDERSGGAGWRGSGHSRSVARQNRWAISRYAVWEGCCPLCPKAQFRASSNSRQGPERSKQTAHSRSCVMCGTAGIFSWVIFHRAGWPDWTDRVTDRVTSSTMLSAFAAWTLAVSFSVVVAGRVLSGWASHSRPPRGGRNWRNGLS
ncbi:hypothetical protein CTZ27_00785 [Streptomyces griseocarneus]|nr:hypothetical protein CTZ27_00785 [Streptomyces griseocarneus]